MKREKLPGLCEFCGRVGVTKQHVWPDWMEQVLPKVGQSHMQARVGIHLGLHGEPTAAVVPDLREVRGHTGARKIRKFCQSCNNNWMSKVEGDAKSAVLAMMQGASTSLDVNEQRLIAVWLVLFSIVAEYTDVPTQVIPKADRLALLGSGDTGEVRSPPDHWQIWIAPYKGTAWLQRYRHHGMRMLDGSGLHVMTAVAGSLLVHAVRWSESLDQPEFAALRAKLPLPIWPPVMERANFDIGNAIDDAMANSISDELYRYLQVATFQKLKDRPDLWRLMARAAGRG